MRKNINQYKIYGDYAILTIIDNKKRITDVIIDSNQVEYLKQYSFRINGNGYIKTGNNLYLHQIITKNTDKAKEVDHINRNKLDNRLCNLRVCYHRDNVKNRLLSELQGITKLKRLKSKPYLVRVNHKHCGYYSTLEEAIKIRNSLYEAINKEYSPL